MKVSVIVPIYNTSCYLRQCLESLEKQTYKNIEVVCVNDGSTDNSLDIIMEFVNRDSRFTVINKENTGYGNSMNIGFGHATGEYVGILESDDFAEPDMYEKLISQVMLYHPDIVKGDFNKYNRKGVREMFNNLEGLPYREVFRAEAIPYIYRAHPSIWTGIYKKSFLVENDIRFLETPGASFQDISFSYKVLHSAKSIVCIPDVILNYRVENVESSIHNPSKIYCVCDEIDEMKRFIEERYQKSVIDSIQYKKAKQVINHLLYKNYIWNYDRIALQYKREFLAQTREAFLQMPEDTFEIGIWSDGDIEIWNAVTKCFGLYYSWTARKWNDQRLEFFRVLNDSTGVSRRAFLGFVEDSEKISIYGAGVVGQKVYQFFKDRGLQKKIKNFVVSKKEEEINDFAEIPIVEIGDLLEEEFDKNLFIVAVSKKFQIEVLDILDTYNAKNIILIDDELRAIIENR